MTLLELATFVTDKVGQTDARSLALCKSFVQKRYQMIYDSFPWRDSETTAVLTIAGDIPDPAGVFSLPDGMDRVISILADGDRYLDPVNVNMLMQTDPGIFTRLGAPTSYREYSYIDPFTQASTKKIQVYPTPGPSTSVTTSLLIVGKATLVPLSSDSSATTIRNIDNCLIAYVTGDMYERQRRGDAAQAKFTEASAMLTALQTLETGQGNQPRRAKQLTVAGNSLAELTDQVCAQTGQWSPDSVVLIKNFLRSNYQSIWDMYNWQEATVCATVNNDGPEVILPSYFDRVLQVRFDPLLGALSADQPSVVFQVSPQLFEQTGTVISYSYLTPVGVSVLPPTRERLTFFSSSDNDRSELFIRGELEGEEVSDSITLAGLLTVRTLHDYDTPLTVAKNITAGDIKVHGETSGALLETLLAGERERKHIRLWLQPTPTSAKVLLVLGKRTITPFAQDEDTTLLRDIGAALIASASADMFARIGNDKGAADQREQAKQALQALISLETQQGAYSARVIPQVDYSPDWSTATLTKGWV